MPGVTAPPFIIRKPKILVGDVATGVEIQCAGNQVEASPEQDENTYETFCGTYTAYKPEVWTITLTAYQSYGSGGLWNLLRPLTGTVQPFELLPDADAPQGPDNPLMSGEALVRAFPFVTGTVGEASELEVVLAVQGIPDFDVGVGGGLMATGTSDTADSGETGESERETALV